MPAEAATALWGVGAGLLLFWLGSGAVAVWQGRRSAKAQVSGDEREARRDTLSDRDKLLEHYAARFPALEQQVHDLWQARAADHAAIRARDDHIDALQSQIWRGDPPPPVAPPTPY